MTRAFQLGILISVLAVVFILPLSVKSQVFDKSAYRYISPLPGSKYIMPENNIAVRQGEPLVAGSADHVRFEVRGTKSGMHLGRILLSDDNKTLIFIPHIPFLLGERVTVKIDGIVRTVSGKSMLPVEFYFDIAPTLVKLPSGYSNEISFNRTKHQISVFLEEKIVQSTNDNDLPDDFPEISIVSSNNPPEDGYYFVSPFGYWGWFPENVPYLVIMDYFGVPVFYRRLSSDAYDLKLQQNGKLTYYNNEWAALKNLVMDSSFNIIDELSMQNGYSTDFHECLLLSNGHAFVTGTDPQIVNMDTVVPGGYSQATVVGWVFQELDQNKNVVFQWRSWDHYLITDADEHINLYDTIIDAVHGNSIEVYSDNSLLLSARNLNEITKIDWNTGEIIWRLGGENNMFDFVDDPLGFSRQHDCRKLSNGHITIFDNGSYHPDPQFSSCLEYEINEDDMTVLLLRRLRDQPDNFGTIMGSCQQSISGNFIAGWGSGVPAITEFNTDNEIVNEIYIEGINYRAYRFPWQTSYFEIDADSVHFGYIWYQDTLVKNITVTNYQDFAIDLTGFFITNENFKILDEFPIAIDAGGQKTIQVEFNPQDTGYFSGRITLNSDINTEELTQRIAQQIDVMGIATEGQVVESHNTLSASVYPVPAVDLIRIKLEENSTVELFIFNQLEELVQSKILNNETTFVWSIASLPKGIYYIKIIEPSSGKRFTQKIIKV
ncbi:MAG: aryl-sulfate sulfotransferase [Bacteroidales bacterium]|nr:aryl-sulfate sulfotransferase [Bacteroidales bacterium]